MKAINFLHGLFTIAVCLLDEVVTNISDAVVRVAPAARKSGYDAHFGNPHDVLSKGSNGFHIGEWSVPFTECFSAIVFGGSNSFKTTSHAFNTILQNHTCSYVINDPSSELFHGTATALARAGYSIIVFDCDDPLSSARFNGLARCTDDSSLHSFIHVLVRNALEQAEYDYWAQSSEAMIVLFGKYLIRFAAPAHRNLSTLLYLIQVFSVTPEKIDRLFVRCGDEKLLIEYRSLVATPERTLLSTVATAKNILRIFSDENVAAVTSTDTINIDTFRIQKTALYLRCKATKANVYRPLTAAIFETFFTAILESPPYNKELLIAMIIEEAASIRLPHLGSFLALTRKHNCAISTIWQDFNQINAALGVHEAQNIFANSNLKIFMGGGKPPETCTMLEKMLGRYTITDEAGVTTHRELLTAQECRELREVLVLKKASPPVLIAPAPYYTCRRLRALTMLPVYQLPIHTSINTPSNIPLD